MIKFFFLRNIIAIISFVLSVQLCCGQDISSRLKVGDPAPPLKVLKWLKGIPINRFERGMFYIVEFTGSLCVPCRAVAPHLTTIAKEYKGRVEVLAVCIYENMYPDPSGKQGYLTRCREFVESMGEKMEYSVAVDDPMQTVATTWMRAASQGGIPTLFLINEVGNIVWIGHPNYIDNVLSQVFSKGAEGHLIVAEGGKLERRARALEEKDWATAILITDSLIAEYPEVKAYYDNKFDFMLSLDEKNAYLFGWSLLNNQLKHEDGLLLYLARDILTHAENRTLKTPDWDLALTLCLQGYKNSKDSIMSARCLEMVAYVYYTYKKDKVSALSFQRRAIKYLKGYEASDSFISSYMSTLKYKLDMYAKGR